ncbi:hypothetical protein GVN24_23295 [Rhizobium sp. CRIBSB]|nr:hypothetical protein [Rhizobium sp. CRIBSB]
MNDDQMDHKSAQFVVRGLIKRFAPNADGNFDLQGPITSEDVEALRLLAGASSTPIVQVGSTSAHQTSRQFGEPVTIGSITPELASLSAPLDEDGDIVAVDFGTAFSKASLWPARAKTPLPLDLAGQVTDASGNMLESSVYVTEGVIYFGPKAEAIFRQEDSPARAMFDAPKQELSLLGGETLGQTVSPELDPTGSLTKRDLLTLYLAYFSATISAALEAAGAHRYTTRRFAVPVWKAEKLATVSRVLKRRLVDAQVIADTLPFEAWKQGLAVTDAKRLLDMLAATITDEKRDGVEFISRRVVEAAAAAAAIGEKLANRRPVVLVMDVGAGTTDIGLYRFALPSSDNWKIAAFESCQGALNLAGRALDDRLIEFIKARAGVDPTSIDGQRVVWALRRDVRRHKALLFDTGFVDVEELGGQRFSRDEFLAAEPVKSFTGNLRRQVTDLLGEVGRSSIEQKDGQFAVVTGGGANVSIFRDLFDESFELSDGALKLEFMDASPEWLDDYTPDIRGIFPQLAVSIGASSPYLPDELRPITDASVAPRRVAGVNYRS